MQSVDFCLVACSLAEFAYAPARVFAHLGHYNAPPTAETRQTEPSLGLLFLRTFPSAFSSKALQALSGLPSGEGLEHPSLSFISRGRREQREGRTGRSCRVLGVVLGLQARPED